MTNPTLRRLRDRMLSTLILARGLPAYLPFLPLIWRWIWGGSRLPPPPAVPGSLTTAEREWLAAQARQTPADGVIVQSGPLEIDATCALAAGCWASRRRVYALLPPTAAPEAVREWHRAVILQGLGPYVIPQVEEDNQSARVNLLMTNEPEKWRGRIAPGGAVIMSSKSLPSCSIPGQPKRCGSLVVYVI